MELITEPYLLQKAGWPPSGRHILAHYDDRTVVVFQAFRPEIGHFASDHGCFGGEFSFSRMSWIKPSFLWMMYRSAWGTAPGQEVILAIWLERTSFDDILKQAIHSHYVPEFYETEEAWKRRLRQSEVRLQWDPDRTPSGGRTDRRAIQLGLRGDTLKQYSGRWIVEIKDISDFVRQQRENANRDSHANLIVPKQAPYEVEDVETIMRLGLSRML